MNIEVGYFPKRYYDSNPDAGGFFPFAIEGTTPYVFSMDGFYLPECDENFLPLWMRNIQAFPLYFCAEVSSYCKEEFEHNCKEFNISYRYLTNRYVVTEIQNEKQFQEIFPFYITLGSGNDLVLWSTNKDVFSVEQREWKGNWEGKIVGTVVVKVEVDTSIFWIGYDGDNIAVISSQSNFATYKKIIKTFPDFVVPKLCKYE
ncbi:MULTISPECIES: hypothetical protein [Bacillaceae]|uniref:hypothetical protein n=1 Tax=Bacillaceae TaxID=186817 RepID=UPI000C336D09|nr:MULTISPECIES: hypothetical protein [Bacillaceae]PKF86774.1 hypothetical protein CW306_21830 [Bacillus sp. BA3]CAH0123656.1 hypothetical protein SRABI134_00021 [Peribacillus sp. Bi134]